MKIIVSKILKNLIDEMMYENKRVDKSAKSFIDFYKTQVQSIQTSFFNMLKGNEIYIKNRFNSYGYKNVDVYVSDPHGALKKLKNSTKPVLKYTIMVKGANTIDDSTLDEIMEPVDCKSYINNGRWIEIDFISE